jgi:hypothetical protein
MQAVFVYRKGWHTAIIAFVLLAAWAGQGWCDGDDRFARAATNSIGPFLAAGELSLFFSGKEGKRKAWQGAEAVLATSMATELLKRTVREKRPNSNERTSFPSGHASAAFAMATVLSEYQPKYKWLAYGGASVIAWSRVETHAHRWRDVVAGAVLGHTIAKRFARKRIALTPEGLGFQMEW